MEFTVIIPAYRDWDRLRKCLDRLTPAVQGRSDFEVIVVDNDAEHHPPAWLTDKHLVRLVHEPKPGSYAARNSGAALARGKYLAFTDSDCIPEPDWLSKAQNFFHGNRCDMIGGRVDIFRDTGGGEWAWIYEKNIAFRQEITVPQGHSITANFFVRRSLFEQIGGFDSSIKSGGDFEFSSRAVKMGYSLLYADEVCIAHPARKSLRMLFLKQRRFAAWGHINVKKSHGHSSFRIFASHLVHGMRGTLLRSRKPERFREKMVVFWISLGLYFYNIWQHFLIMMRLVDPHRVRE